MDLWTAMSSRAGEEVSALRGNTIYLSYRVSSVMTQIFRREHPQYDTQVKYLPELGSSGLDKVRCCDLSANEPLAPSVF